MNNNKATNENSSYFYQYSHGVGYLNEVREIPNSGIPPRYSAKIAAVQGSSDDTHHEYHELTISSADVFALLLHYKNEIDDEDKKKFIKFYFTNPRAKGFIFEEGKYKGEIGTVTYGYLNRISYMSIDGEVIFQEDKNSSNRNRGPQDGSNDKGSAESVTNSNQTKSSDKNKQDSDSKRSPRSRKAA